MNPRACFGFVCPHYPLYLMGYYMVSDSDEKLESDKFTSKYRRSDAITTLRNHLGNLLLKETEAWPIEVK